MYKRFRMHGEKEWRYNAPSASHLGGLWERGIKSLKTHLEQSNWNSNFHFQGILNIVCIEIEALLNSRALP